MVGKISIIPLKGGKRMPSGSYLQVDITCPFYVSDNGKNTLICEGVIPGVNDHCVFERKSDFLLQVRTFCCGRNEYCERYRAIREKYDEEENHE